MYSVSGPVIRTDETATPSSTNVRGSRRRRDEATTVAAQRTVAAQTRSQSVVIKAGATISGCPFELTVNKRDSTPFGDWLSIKETYCVDQKRQIAIWSLKA